MRGKIAHTESGELASLYDRAPLEMLSCPSILTGRGEVAESGALNLGFYPSCSISMQG